MLEWFPLPDTTANVVFLVRHVLVCTRLPRTIGVGRGGVFMITCIIRMEDYGYGITKGSI